MTVSSLLSVSYDQSSGVDCGGWTLVSPARSGSIQAANTLIDHHFSNVATFTVDGFVCA